MNQIIILIIIALFSFIFIQLYYQNFLFNKNQSNIDQLEQYENSLKSDMNYKLDINTIKNLLTDYYNLKP